MDLSTLTFEEVDNYLTRQEKPIIHQIWFWTIQPYLKAKKDYKNLESFRNSWTFHNPNFCHVIWNEKLAKKLVSEIFPEYYDMYIQYPHEIQRCDAIRYFILYRYGGIYADMDYRCLKSFEPLMVKLNKDIYIVETPFGTGVSNALMISKRNVCVWKKMFMDLYHMKDSYRLFSKHAQVIGSTGPRFLVRCIERHKYRHSIGLLQYEKFHPTSIKDIDTNIKNAYATHLGSGSWESTDSKILVTIYIAWPMLLLILLVLAVPQLILLRNK